jgi:Protein of unknown function (DUF2550)
VGGALGLDAAWLFAAFLVVLVLAAVVIATRRFLLERGGGTVECGLRHSDGSWRLGVASYQPEELCWYGVFGVSMRPEETFSRRDLAVVSRRPPTDAEAAILGPGMIVVEFTLGEGGAPSQAGAPGHAGSTGPGGPDGPDGRGGTVQLALPEAALTGLLAWLEAAPPGTHLDVTLLSPERMIVDIYPPSGGGGKCAMICARELMPELPGIEVARSGPGQPRSPPGFHRTSSCPALAWRDRMNSRSDSRFR